jgi:hypothetical protein
MNKLRWLRWVNFVLFCSFAVQAATGIILFFEWQVPGGPLVDRVHNYNGLFMILLAITHIIFNWGWIKANFLKKVTKGK